MIRTVWCHQSRRDFHFIKTGINIKRHTKCTDSKAVCSLVVYKHIIGNKDVYK